MMIKFRAGPAAHAFAGFDGIKRTCVKYAKAKGGVLRCERFKKGKGHPVRDKRLVDGGRSPGLLRCHGPAVPCGRVQVAKQHKRRRKG